MLTVILLAFAFMCFILAFIGVWEVPPGRPRLLALGLAFWVLSVLLGVAHL